MNVFIVKNGDEIITETTSYYRAVEICREIDAKYGEGSAVLYRYNSTNNQTTGHGYVRVAVNDKSIIK